MFTCWNFCCANVSKAFDPDRQTYNQDIDLKDLLIHPNAINTRLDELISLYERAVNSLHEAETEYLETNPSPEAKQRLEELKSSPSKFLNDPELSNLALLVEKVNDAEKLLPHQADEDSIKSRKLNSSRSSVDLGWTEINVDLRLTGMMDKLSNIWSKRLNNINQTQGALLIAKENDLSNDLKLKPKWPDFLADVNFDVIKVNKYGHKMRRTLRLTQHFVISIKSGAAITKRYLYSDISKIWLQNENTVRVILKSEKRNMYISPIAPHIIQQLTTRVKVRKSLDSKVEENVASVHGYSSQMTAQIIQAISEENVLATEQMLKNFATDLKLRTVSSIADEDPNSKITSEKDITVNPMAPALPSDTSQDMSPNLSTLDGTKGPDSRISQEISRFSTFNENTPEFSIQSSVRKLMFDTDTPEGNTRRSFVQNFLGNEDNSEDFLLKVRHFIDGMHEYILTERASALALLYQQEKQRLLAYQSLGDSLPSSGSKKSNLLRRGSLNFLKENSIAPNQVDEGLLVLISYIIFIVVEEATFLSIKENIIQRVRTLKDHDTEEKMLLEKITYFKERNQEQWGVPEDLVSPLGWQSAVFILSTLEHNLIPSFQLQTLTRAVKAIYSEFKFAILPKLEANGKSNIFIAADDLVPIFIYIFCQAALKHPIQNRDLMWQLCHPDSLHGEGGYYLTVYESAIEFVLNEPVERQAFVGEDSDKIKSHSRMKSPSFAGTILNMQGILAFNETSRYGMRASFA